MKKFLKAAALVVLLFAAAEFETRLYLSRALARFPPVPLSPDKFGTCKNLLAWAKKLGYLEDYKSGHAYSYESYTAVLNRPGYRFQFKNYETVINSMGFRAPEIASPKPKNVFRIFLLGGSTVAGGASEKSTISHYLQKKLKAAGKSVEVINAGVVGYASKNELILLETKILELQPDLVIVLDGRNDLYYTQYPEVGPGHQEQQILDHLVNSPDLRTVIPFSIKVLGHKSYFLTMLFRRLFERKPLTLQSGGRPDPQGIPRYFRNWRNISAILQANRIPGLLIFQPTLAYAKERFSPYEQSAISYIEENEKSDWLQDAQKLWPKVSEKARNFPQTPQVKVHDLSRLFLKNSRTVYYDDCHYAPYGCNKIAGALAALVARDFPRLVSPIGFRKAPLPESGKSAQSGSSRIPVLTSP